MMGRSEWSGWMPARGLTSMKCGRPGRRSGSPPGRRRGSPAPGRRPGPAPRPGGPRRPRPAGPGGTRQQLLALLLVDVGIDLGLGPGQQDDLHAAQHPGLGPGAQHAHGELPAGQEGLDQDRLAVAGQQLAADRPQRGPVGDLRGRRDPLAGPLGHRLGEQRQRQVHADRRPRAARPRRSRAWECPRRGPPPSSAPCAASGPAPAGSENV